MTRPPEALRQCPTLPDESAVLIAQTITRVMCQDRQRGLYHKCWSCALRNGSAPAVARKPLAKLPAVPVLDLSAAGARRAAAV